ncbi:hypothetical protein M0804_011535 [Polistes exclamans]|nr:hypothetical protein M0804_011535 [Polistes exclamans]
MPTRNTSKVRSKLRKEEEEEEEEENRVSNNIYLSDLREEEDRKRIMFKQFHQASESRRVKPEVLAATAARRRRRRRRRRRQLRGQKFRMRLRGPVVVSGPGSIARQQPGSRCECLWAPQRRQSRRRTSRGKTLSTNRVELQWHTGQHHARITATEDPDYLGPSSSPGRRDVAWSTTSTTVTSSPATFFKRELSPTPSHTSPHLTSPCLITPHFTSPPHLAKPNHNCGSLIPILYDKT